jgi:hypothetical protein
MIRFCNSLSYSRSFLTTRLYSKKPVSPPSQPLPVSKAISQKPASAAASTTMQRPRFQSEIDPTTIKPRLQSELSTNTLLFSTRKRSFFIMTSLAALSQAALWCVMGPTFFFAMTSGGGLAPLWQRVGAGAVSAIVAGSFLYLAVWYPSLYVKQIELNERTKAIRFSTYTVMGGEKKQPDEYALDSLQQVNKNDASSKHWWIFKVKGRSSKFRIDMQGTVHNKELFCRAFQREMPPDWK